jgi:hypothetical protein
MTKPDADIIEDTLDEIYTKAKTILESKGHDYSNDGNRFANFEKVASVMNMTPEQAFVFYLSIKVTRLSELFGNNKKPNNESIEDTLIDLINYAILFYSYRTKMAFLGFEKDVEKSA